MPANSCAKFAQSRVFRFGGAGRGISLIITRIGRDAIGVETEEGSVEEPAPKERKTRSKAQNPSVAVSPRAGSKQAPLVDMLSRNKGTTLEALTKATGWLPHTIRAALTCLRKRGFAIERSRGDGEPSVYRIVK